MDKIEDLTPSRLLGLRGRLDTPGALVSRLRAGLPERSLTALARALDLQRPQLNQLLRISARTARRRKGATLRPDESDRAFRVARVFAFAIRVLEDRAVARDWMRTPNTALGGVTPLSLLDTDPGARSVEDVLGRIEFGVYG
jgi:putative toxin-antitoxin system antitoxin component (TIGR02293 family)